MLRRVLAAKSMHSVAMLARLGAAPRPPCGCAVDAGLRARDTSAYVCPGRCFGISLAGSIAAWACGSTPPPAALRTMRSRCALSSVMTRASAQFTTQSSPLTPSMHVPHGACCPTGCGLWPCSHSTDRQFPLPPGPRMAPYTRSSRLQGCAPAHRLNARHLWLRQQWQPRAVMRRLNRRALTPPWRQTCPSTAPAAVSSCSGRIRTTRGARSGR